MIANREIKINQIGFVVTDLDKKLKEFEKIGFGPFNIITANNVEIFYKEKKRTIDMKIALSNIGELQIELIEAKGKSFYTDFLKDHGEGLNHLGVFVSNIDRSIKEYKKLGFKILQSGDIYGVKWIYLDTIKRLGFVLELIEVP